MKGRAYRTKTKAATEAATFAPHRGRSAGKHPASATSYITAKIVAVNAIRVLHNKTNQHPEDTEMPETSIDLDRAATTTREADPQPSPAQLAWLEAHARLSEYTEQRTPDRQVQS